ncbi:MAG TPA: hypothetical protein VNV85_09095 [Puia sp.]|jgi:hypothetical protein|nr:hypothetical protein [Puia sp.]
MTLKSLGFFLIAFALAATSLGQTENSVDVRPHWKSNETHSVKIKSTTTDNNNGKAQNYVSTFEAKFIVKEASDSGYKVEWTYTNSKLADNDPVVENQIVARLTNTKLLIKLSDVGRFVELMNVDEVKTTANKVIDELIANSSSNPTMNAQYKGAKQLIASKQGLEIALLKQIKFYNFSFGFNYKLNFVQTNNIKLPNPMGGQNFDGVEKVQLTKLDKKNFVCVIETNKIVDGKILKTAVIDYVKRVTNSNPQAIDEMNKASLTMTENTMQQIDYARGIIQESFFKRTMNFGFQNRTIVLEIETAD